MPALFQFAFEFEWQEFKTFTISRVLIKNGIAKNDSLRARMFFDHVGKGLDRDRVRLPVKHHVAEFYRPAKEVHEFFAVPRGIVNNRSLTAGGDVGGWEDGPELGKPDFGLAAKNGKG